MASPSHCSALGRLCARVELGGQHEASFYLWLGDAVWVCAGQAEGDVENMGGWGSANSLFLSAPGSVKHLSLPPDVHCVYGC